MTPRRITCLAVLAALTAVGSPSTLAAQTPNEWREDLRVLATELPARHPNAFARITRAQWDSAVQRLDARLPQLRRYEVIVEFMRLVAMVGDGHTSLAPERAERAGFHRFPIQLYDFSDGLYIVSADSAHADLAGARVVTIGPSPAAAAIETAGGVISHEGPNWVRARAASLLAISELLAALGMGRDSMTADFGIEMNGRKRTVTLTATAPAAGDAHMAPAQQADMRRGAAGDDPLWMQRPGVNWWYTITPDRMLYINERGVQVFSDGMSNEAFFRRAFAAGDSAHVERVVLDIRDNGGGNNFMNRFVVKEIIRHPALDQRDKLFVLIGRGVFSAAQNLVNELAYYTNATFVGEPTGNSPNQYGDARPLELPHSHLVVFVSSLLWQSHQAADRRAWFTPDVYVEMSSDDYRAKRDPLLDAVRRRATAPSFAQQLEAPATAGDTALLRRRISAYRDSAENKYRDVEADVNATGYRLLQSGKVNAALTIFTMNTRLYPQSGNAFDSLGEALERGGRRDDAIAAYRKAVQLEPRMFSSREALRRLGASP